MGFASETTIKAVRKRHRCDGCVGVIEVGETAIRWAGTTDGEFGAATYHPDCRAAEIALNEVLGFQYGDEWTALSEIEDEDRPWLRDDFPAVALRLGITAPADTDPSGPQGTEAALSAPDEPLPQTPSGRDQ